MRLLFLILIFASCSKALQPKDKIAGNPGKMPEGLTAHDSVYLYQAQKDLSEMKQLSKLKKQKPCQKKNQK